MVKLNIKQRIRVDCNMASHWLAELAEQWRADTDYNTEFYKKNYYLHAVWIHQLLTGKNGTLIKADVIQWPTSHSGISIYAG